MNLLVGILVKVVGDVSDVEKEQMDVIFVRNSIWRMIEETGADTDGDQRISKGEFVNLIQQPDAARALQKIGVDVVGLVDYTDFLFVAEESISFPDFMEMVLELRGSNSATVKEIMDFDGKINHIINTMSCKNPLGKTRASEHATN